MLRLLQQPFWILIKDQSCNTVTKTDKKHGDEYAREKLAIDPKRKYADCGGGPTVTTTNMGTVLRAAVNLGN